MTIREKAFLSVQDEERMCRICESWDVQGHYCYAKTPQNCRKVEQILNLMKGELDKLTVMSKGEEDTLYRDWTSNKGYNMIPYWREVIKEAHLNHTKKQLKEWLDD